MKTHFKSARLRVVACLLFGLQHLVAQNNHPNILFILADDMGIDVTNGYIDSDEQPNTPTLDSLRTRGITYMNTWSSPTCTPSRAAIMSGKFGTNTGVFRAPGNLDVSDTSMFNAIKNADEDRYAGAVIGKWHLSNPVNYNHPAQHGVDYYEGAFTAFVDDYYNWEKVTNGEVSNETEYATTALTNSAIDWIEDQSKPWLLWLSHVAPHNPFHVPPEGLYTIENTNGQRNRYFAAIEAMDHEIGRLLNTMDQATRENTTVIFLGDNGSPAPAADYFTRDHLKASIYEGGIRVPLIIAGKGVERINEQEEGLTHVADIYATVLELAGIPLDGGIYNSYSLKPSFSCSGEIERDFVYTDYEEDNVQSWAIRNDQYKLIEDENGRSELYDIVADLQEQNDLANNLTNAQQAILTELSNEAEIIRTGWSCNDGIKNGDEEGIDACDIDCDADDTLSTTNIGCCATPEEPSVFYEYTENGSRFLYSNNFPNHNYCFNPNLIPEQKYYNFEVDLTPEVSGEITYMTRPNGRPFRYFGVALNGVVIVPVPAEPFIFQNPQGEFNWDWVFEPTTNQGEGRDFVSLDCASAHTGPQGYHYHGNMFEYMETIIPGSTTRVVPPSEPIHIGWASDGFPILYRFGPDKDGNIKELAPSFQLRQGERPGNGIEEPCGPYNGKYTRDFEYICGKGDLDECNGINSPVTLTTQTGTQTFDYYYVITTTFPQISRCMVGNVSTDFQNNATALTGVDNDNDGFLARFDCDDNDPQINPLTAGPNCETLSEEKVNVLDNKVQLSPNPSSGYISISAPDVPVQKIEIYNTLGQLVKTANEETLIINLSPGIYLAKIRLQDGSSFIKKVIIN